MEGMAEMERDGGMEKSVHFLVSRSPLSSSLTGGETQVSDLYDVAQTSPLYDKVRAQSKSWDLKVSICLLSLLQPHCSLSKQIRTLLKLNLNFSLKRLFCKTVKSIISIAFRIS